MLRGRAEEMLMRKSSAMLLSDVHPQRFLGRCTQHTLFMWRSALKLKLRTLKICLNPHSPF